MALPTEALFSNACLTGTNPSDTAHAASCARLWSPSWFRACSRCGQDCGREQQRAGHRGDHRPGRSHGAEPANHRSRGHAQGFHRVGGRASLRCDRTRLGVVSVRQLGGQRPQLSRSPG
jgi:hypothetical protein